MARVTPQLMVDLIKTFPQEEREIAQRDLAAVMRPPYLDLNCKLKCQALPVPIGLLEYALRFGTLQTLNLLRNAVEATAGMNDREIIVRVSVSAGCSTKPAWPATRNRIGRSSSRR